MYENSIMKSITLFANFQKEDKCAKISHCVKYWILLPYE